MPIERGNGRHALELARRGYEEVGIFAARIGAFSREDKLTADDFEMLVVAAL